MKFFSKHELVSMFEDNHSDTSVVFRFSRWGTLLGLVIFVSGLIMGLGALVLSMLASTSLGVMFSSIYCLLLWFVCRMVYRMWVALGSSANWLARFGPEGALIKYRSYLHDDSPAEDPIAMLIPWRHIVSAQLQQERYTSTDNDGKYQNKRWFLQLQLDARFIDLEKVKSALAFEHQRKPAHFKVDELKRALFLARKSKSDASEIDRLKRLIKEEKAANPGNHAKSRFLDRPVLFAEPATLKILWSHLSPGKKCLRQLLQRYATVMKDTVEDVDISKPMTDAEFANVLATLIDRDDRIEAYKLVRLQKGISLSEAVDYVDVFSQQR